MKRLILTTMSALAACLMTSCFESEVTLRMNKDGSGLLTEETTFGAQAVMMMEQLAQMGGNRNAIADLSSEPKAKERAAKLGAGVTVEKVEVTGKDGGKGGRVTYRFADINTLKFAPDSGLKSAMPT